MTTLEKLEELIYKGFKETDLKFQENAKESERIMRENAERSKETDRIAQETSRIVRENSEELKAYAKQKREDDAKWNKRFSGITDSLGLFAENMVSPALERLFAQRGFVLTNFDHRARHRHNGSTMEVDVLASGGQHIVAVEVKFTLKQRDVAEFFEKLPRFFDFYERFRGLTLYGAVAGMNIDKDADRYAYNHGLFVLAQSGENILLLNDEKFIPRPYTYSA